METRLLSRFHSKAWLLGLKANDDQTKGEKLLFCGLRATEHSNAGMKVEKFSVALIITTTLFPRLVNDKFDTIAILVVLSRFYSYQSCRSL